MVAAPSCTGTITLAGGKRSGMRPLPHRRWELRRSGDERSRPLAPAWKQPATATTTLVLDRQDAVVPAGREHRDESVEPVVGPRGCRLHSILPARALDHALDAGGPLHRLQVDVQRPGAELVGDRGRIVAEER